MTICIITNLYPPFARGGAEQVVWQSARALSVLGHRVIVITTSLGAQTMVEEDGVRVYRLLPRNIYPYTEAHKHSFVIRLFWHLFGMLPGKVVREVLDIISKEKPDIVHTHNLMGLSFAIPSAIRGMYPWVHTVHDVQLYEPSGIILKTKEHSYRYTGLPSRLYAALLRSRMGSPDVVISPSQFLLDFYRAKGFFPESSLLLLRNPLTVHPEGQSPNYMVSNACRFLYVGQIEPHKGIETLVAAFASFIKNGGQATLSLVGDGSLLTFVESVRSTIPNILVHGRQKREVVERMYREADVVVVPSLCYENSPTVIMESFAFGVPVIASNVNGIIELIAEGENGFLFEAGNAEALARVLEMSAGNKPFLRRMGEHAFRTISSPAPEAFVSSLLSVYGDIISGKARHKK